MNTLEAVQCNGCGKDACYVRDDEVEDMPDPIYCVNCVVIQPKEKTS